MYGCDVPLVKICAEDFVAPVYIAQYGHASGHTGSLLWDHHHHIRIYMIQRPDANTPILHAYVYTLTSHQLAYRSDNSCTSHIVNWVMSVIHQDSKLCNWAVTCIQKTSNKVILTKPQKGYIYNYSSVFSIPTLNFTQKYCKFQSVQIKNNLSYTAHCVWYIHVHASPLSSAFLGMYPLLYELQRISLQLSPHAWAAAWNVMI